MSTRTVGQTEGDQHVTRIQNKLVSSAATFRAELERDLKTALSNGGFSAADAITARTTVINAVKAVLW